MPFLCRWLAVIWFHGIAATLATKGNRFVVYIPVSMRIPDIKDFSRMVNLFWPPDEDMLDLLEYVDMSEFLVSLVLHRAGPVERGVAKGEFIWESL